MPLPPNDSLVRQSASMVFFAGRQPISRAIAIATCDVRMLLRRQLISHVGFTFEDAGEILLCESTTLDDEPCCLTGRRIQGVQAHPLLERIARYDGRVWLCPAGPGVAAKIARRKVMLRNAVLSKIGQPYDELGALVSGATTVLRHWWHFAPHRFFCSELTAWALRTIGVDPLGFRQRRGLVLPCELFETGPRNGFIEPFPIRVLAADDEKPLDVAA